MIAYEELSAALERWRVKNGLPGTPPLFAEGSTMKRPAAAPPPSYTAPAASYSAPAASYSAPAPSYSAPAPSYSAPPPAPAPAAPKMPPPPSPETLDEDVGEFAEDDVLAEAELDNEGPDYAMSFGSSPPKPVSPQSLAGKLSDEDERESTLLGSTDPGIVPPPANYDFDRPRSAATVVDDEDADEYNAAEKTPT